MLTIEYERDGTRSFFIDGEPVTEAEAMRRFPDKPCNKVPALQRAPDQDWEKHNNGKGEWIPQLGRRTDPNAYVPSRNVAIERLKARGYSDIERC